MAKQKSTDNKSVSKQTKKTKIVTTENNYFVFSLMGVFLVFVFLATTFKIADDDFFWHLATGRYIVENGVVPGTDVFGETTQNVTWIPFEWGWDVVSFLLYKLNGYNMILVFRSLMFVLMFGIYYGLFKKFNINSVLSFIFLFALIIGMLDRLTPRPHLISYVFFVLLLYILVSFKYLNREKYFRYVYFLPLIFFVWGNFHPGVLAGGLILFIFTVSELLVNFFPKSLATAAVPALTKQQIIRLFIISVLSAAVLLINPHGLQTYIYSYEHTNMKMLEYIKEWRSPFDPETGYGFINLFFKIFLFSGALILIYAFKKKDIFFALMYIGFVIYSVRAIRFMIDYEIVICFFLLFTVNYYLDLLKQKKAFEKVLSFIFYNNGVKIILVLFTLFVIYNLPDGSAYLKIRYYRQFGYGIDKNYMPVQLIDFMKDNKITGKAYNYFESGGILVWSIPGQKNFIDSRNLNDDIYFEYRSIMNKNAGYAEKFDKYGFDFVLYVDPDLIRRPQTLQTNIVSFVSDNPGWKLVYWDDRSFLFLKNEEKYSQIINKYEYKILNLYDYVSNQQVFYSKVKSNTELAKSELERKSVTEPNGVIYENMKMQVNKILGSK